MASKPRGQSDRNLYPKVLAAEFAARSVIRLPAPSDRNMIRIAARAPATEQSSIMPNRQPVAAEAILTRLNVTADLIVNSGGWGLGDRLDNDVLPVLAAVFLRRAPRDWIHAERPEIEQAHIRLDSLLDLAERLAAP